MVKTLFASKLTIRIRALNLTICRTYDTADGFRPHSKKEGYAGNALK